MTAGKGQHTPGPWAVREGLYFDIDEETLVLGIHGETPIGIAWLTKARPEAEANARLIAAAPALLEALREIDESLTHVLERVVESAKDDSQLGVVGALFLVAKAQKARARAAIRLAGSDER